MEIPTKKKIISNSKSAAQVFQAVLNAESEIDRNKEHFWVMGINPRMAIQYLELVTLGLLSNTLVHPREVFRMAIFKGVNAIIVAHNHPSGDVTPSSEDKAITEKLISASEILSIPILDHIIITEEEYYSFSDQGILRSCKDPYST